MNRTSSPHPTNPNNNNHTSSSHTDNGRAASSSQPGSFFPYISAATLTYTTAPYPFTLEPVWSSLFLQKQEEEEARQNAKKSQQYIAQLQREEEEEQQLFRRGSSTAEGGGGEGDREEGAARSRLAVQASRYYTSGLSAVQGWVQRAWTGVKTFTANRSVSYRQLCFTKLFSRQLELLPPSSEGPAVYPASRVSSFRTVSPTTPALEQEEAHPGAPTSRGASPPPSSTHSRDAPALPPGATVFVSVCCAIMSLGQPQAGTLFLTSEGFYFCSDVLLEREMNSHAHASSSSPSRPSNDTDTNAATPNVDFAALRRAFVENKKRSLRMWGTSNPASTSSSSEEETDAEGYNSASTADLSRLYDNSDDEGPASARQLLDGREVIKDWVPMADVASILPSVHLPLRVPKKHPSPSAAPPGHTGPPSRGGKNGTPPPPLRQHSSHEEYLYDYRAQDKYYYDGGFYFQGIPHILVRPTALQLFARESRQLYQFIGLHSVVIKPPKQKHSFNNKNNNGAELPSPSMVVSDGDVLTPEEYAVLHQLDGAYATFIVCVLAARLWAQQRRRQRWQRRQGQLVQGIVDSRADSAFTESPTHRQVQMREEEEEEEDGWLQDMSLLVLPDVEYAPPH